MTQSDQDTNGQTSNSGTLGEEIQALDTGLAVAEDIVKTGASKEAINYTREFVDPISILAAGYSTDGSSAEKLKAATNEVGNVIFSKIAGQTAEAVASRVPLVSLAQKQIGKYAEQIAAWGLEFLDPDYVGAAYNVVREYGDFSNEIVRENITKSDGTVTSKVTDHKNGTTTIWQNYGSTANGEISYDSYVKVKEPTTSEPYLIMEMEQNGAKLKTNFTTGTYELTLPNETTPIDGNLLEENTDPLVNVYLDSLFNSYGDINGDSPNAYGNFTRGVDNWYQTDDEGLSNELRFTSFIDVNGKSEALNIKFTDQNLFEFSFNGVSASYDSLNDEQLLYYQDSNSGKYYILKMQGDGSFSFAHPYNNKFVTVSSYVELSSQDQVELDYFRSLVNELSGPQLEYFFENYPEYKQGVLVDFLNQEASSNSPIATPPIPGRKPNQENQEDEQAENNETFDTNEEPSTDVDGQQVNLLQFSNKVDIGSISNDQLFKYITGDFDSYEFTQNHNLRFEALTEAFQRWNSDPNILLADDLAFIEKSNGGEVSHVLIQQDGQTVIPGGAITRVEKGGYTITAVETIGIDDVADTVQLITEDQYSNSGLRSEPMTLIYPENFVFQDIGGYVGGVLATQLADGNTFQEILYKSIFTTAGESLGTYVDFLTQDTLSKAAAHAATQGVDTGVREDLPSLSEGLAKNLNAAVSNFLASKLTEIVTDQVEIDGVGGIVFDQAVNLVAISLVEESLDVVFQGLDSGIFEGLFDGKFNFGGSLSGSFNPASLGQLGANFLARELAGEVIAAESTEAAVLGSVGSYIGSKIIGSYAGAALSTVLTSIGFKVGSIVPIIGNAIGAFIGQVAGTLIGNLFGDQDEPYAVAFIKSDIQEAEYVVDLLRSGDGGSKDTAFAMASAVMNGVNAIIETTQGNFRRSTHEKLDIGYEGSRFFVRVDGDRFNFKTSGEAIEFAALKLLKGADIVGGHAIAMRAWYNSEATTLAEFQQDISVAEAFQTYLLNPTGIIALMLNEPESEAAIQWAAILQRAAELELHLPHAKDIDGGWGELLAARGDINPDAIPDIEGDTIILTDPVTGEEIRIEHVIGPGYEIVRIPGTDGNDIIQVIVDGESITYTDAGPGDDTFVGHDGRDVFIGGDGDDTASGGAGDDWLLGNDGDDYLYGEVGDDLLVGGDGDDVLEGGEGVDTIIGGLGNDNIMGNEHADYLYGGLGNDTIYGNEGLVDRIYGEEGDDILHGLDNDELDGGLGSDALYLDGAATAIINRGDGHDIVYVPGEGNSITFANDISANEVSLFKSGNDLILSIDGEDQSITIKDLYLMPRLQIPHLNFFDQKNARGDLTTITFNLYLSSNPAPYVVGRSNYIGNSSTPDGEIDASFYHLYSSPSRFNNSKNANIRVLSGTEGDDVFTNANENLGQYIYANRGNDHITLAGKDDLAVGGLGDDIIFAHAGDDTIFGGAGDDIIDGGDGNDELVGGSGKDNISGGAGDDFIEGNEGHDMVSGGDGSDVISGGFGNDVIFGGNGDDVLNGDDGNDALNGGDGDDFISGGLGDDIIVAGTGSDVINGNEGDDTVSYDLEYSNYEITIENSKIVVKDLLNGSDIDNLYNVEFLEFQNDLYRFSIQNQVLQLISITLLGTISDDLLIGTNDVNIINGGDGNDIIIGGAEDDRLFGEAGNDTLKGGLGNDTLRAGLDDDTYVVSGGKDVVSDDGGIDVVLLENLSDAHSLSIHVIENDYLIYNNVNEDVVSIKNQLITENKIEQLQFEDGSQINLEKFEDWILGTELADRIVGTAEDDVILGYEDHDTLYGQAGNDEVFGGDGNDFIKGNYGDDLLHGGDGDDRLYGEQDNDKLYGGNGNDFLHSGPGDDLLYGGEGVDGLYSYNGDDILYGGAGDDTLNSGVDNDILYGGEGNDKLYAQTGDDELYGGDGDDILRGEAGFDYLEGGSGDDSIYGHGDDDILHGNDGDDLILGGNQNDLIKGGSGNDTLNGGYHDDLIYGEDGLDIMTGSNGADTFVFEADNAFNDIDEITDFRTAHGDKIDISDVLEQYDPLTHDITDFVQITKVGAHSTLSVDANGGADNFIQIATLRNVSGLEDELLLENNGNLITV